MSDPFSVVRQAHRICAAYYQQIFPLLNETSQKLETTFVHWDTWSFNRPPQRNKNPFETWHWDYLPIMDLSILFSRQHEPGTPMATTDFALEFKLVTDSELSHEQRVKHYGENDEPIASELQVSPEEAQSYLCVYLFSPATSEAQYDSPYTLWDSYNGYPQTDATVHLSDNQLIKGIGYTFQLHELTQDDGSEYLLSKINTLITALLAPAYS